MAALITFEQLIARPGFDNVDQVEAETLIEDASGIIEDIVEPITLDPANLPRTIATILVNMVRRGLDNPLAIPNEQTGDWQGQGRTGLYPTKREVKMIRRAAKTMGARSITLVSPYSGDTSASGS